jgi:16S rRNA (guanine966-N2)-methyltransferase
MSHLRIIAGKYRHRRIPMPEGAHCRPTLDRVRETMFAWLDPILPGAEVLDLFAGTGLLGLEALSRGAAFTTFVETNPTLVQQLKVALATLGDPHGLVLQGHVPERMPDLPHSPFDVVLLDPPYGPDLLSKTMRWIADSAHLRPGAHILAEWGLDHPPTLPATWVTLKAKQTKHLGYGLWKTLK